MRRRGADCLKIDRGFIPVVATHQCRCRLKAGKHSIGFGGNELSGDYLVLLNGPEQQSAGQEEGSQLVFLKYSAS